MIRSRAGQRTLLAVLLSVLAGSQAVAQQLVPGRNVNMSGGSQIISITPFQVRGDVLGRAQNEPSCAISTRNPQHVLCGANDYRMVDVPGVTVSQIIRDAWLGEFQSIDGGDTWESTLLGGFFMDPARHPLKQLGFTAAADPIVRSGPAGLAFYGGIAFTADKSRSVLHVTTYADINNRENDEMPFKPVRTVVVAQASGARFIDKPWMYVEAGAPGATCTLSVPTGANTPVGWTETAWGRLISEWLEARWPGWQPRATVTQRVPASTVHIVYSVFLDPNDSSSDIMYTRSENCGQTFSVPVRLNPTTETTVGLNEHGNGAAIAKPLVAGSQRVYAAWRRVRLVTPTGVLPDAILSVVSNDNGRTWSAPTVLSEICPFDQGTSATSFRTTAFPTMTADATGRVYVAWADRRGADGSCPRSPTGAPIGAGRVRVATSVNGAAWTISTAVPSPTPEHQIMPSIAFTAGRVFLAWIDFRDDASQVFGQFINEAETLANLPAIRHTGDVRAAMAVPGATPAFGDGTAKISQYLRGAVNVNGEKIVGQIQWNAVNRRWARKGTVPFNGDYIDIATMPYLPPDPAAGRPDWTPNNQATMATPFGQVPTAPNILLAWADNRDMRTGPSVDDPAVPVPYQTPAGLQLPANSVYDPSQVRPICTVDTYKTGTTNQNAYSARATIGFVAAAPGNNKNLGTVSRAFVIYLRNDTGAAKAFRLVAVPPPGGFASFNQFVTSRTMLDVVVPRRSSIARTVFVTRDQQSPTPLNPDSPVRVDVIEMEGAAPIQATTLVLNSDATAPELESPELESREIYTPELESPELESATYRTPELESPELESPELESPELESAAWRTLGLQRPELESGEVNAIEVSSPELESPELESPELESTAISDIRFTITNSGNTTAQYNAKAFVTPVDGSDFSYQVIVRRRYELPAVNANCEPTTIGLSKVAVNLPDVALGTPELESPELESPELESAGIATFFLEPGAKAEVIVRARSTTGQQLPANAVDIAVAPPVDSDDAALGITEPEVLTTYLTIATPALPVAIAGAPYTLQLVTSGAVGAVTWSIAAGSLPAGFTLSPSGLLSGFGKTAATSTFRVQAIDADAKVAQRDLTLVVTESGVAALAFVTQPGNATVGQAVNPAISIRAFTAAGAPAANVLVTIGRVDANPLSGTLSRLTGPSGVAVFDDLSIGALAAGVVLRATAGGFTTALSIPFNAGRPDLAFTGLSRAPASPTTTDSIEFKAFVINSGTAPAPPTTTMFRLPGEVDGAPATLVTLPALAVGQAYEIVRVSPPVAEGEQSVLVVLDYQGLVVELNEANNSFFDVFPVIEGGGGDGDVAIDPTAADFAVASGATNRTGPLPNLGDVPSFTVNGLTFTPGSGGDDLSVGTGAGSDWYAALPGNEIALGVESFDVEFAQPVTAIGFYFVEPNTTMPPAGGTPGDSLFGITLYDDGGVVGSYTFNAPDDQVVFVSLQNALPFDRVSFVDLSGNPDDEYFGEFYTSDSENMGTFLVTNTSDGEPGSLRAAMQAAEAQSGKNAIVFDLPGPGPYTITPLSPLPVVTPGNPLLIDATTQAGFAGQPLIELDGSELSEGSFVADGLTIQAGESLVRGLLINRFPRHGIALESNPGNTVIGNWIGLAPDGESTRGNATSGVYAVGSSLHRIGDAGSPLGRNVIAASAQGVFLDNSTGNVVAGNFIGTDATGALARPNHEEGIRLWIGSTLNLVFGNVLSGNGGSGIALAGADANLIRGNIIGLDASGLNPLPNQHGVSFYGGDFPSAGNVLGGLNPGEGNLIAGNPLANVSIASYNSGTVIQGNVIGANADGAVPMFDDPQQFGILLNNASATLIGDATPAGRNVIVNAQRGIQVNSGSGTTITGNYIGTVDGLTAAGDLGYGINVENANLVTIGGPTAAAGNVIVGTAEAIFLLSTGSQSVSGTQIQSNLIGVGADGVTAVPNGGGIHIEAVSGVNSGTLIHGNTIAHNSAGVFFTGDGVTGATVRTNSIHDNAGLGIDLGHDGADLNDPADLDTGPNGRQNSPSITSASVTAGRVVGTLQSAAAAGYIIDFYTNTTCDPSGFGEGQSLVASVATTTNSSGLAAFNVPAPLTLGEFITATATSASGNTSEFSACRGVETSLLVTSAADSGAGTLRSAIVAANAAPDLTTITFAIPGGFNSIPLQSGLPVITAPVVIDGWSQPGFAGAPLIELNGTLTSETSGLRLDASNNVIRGLIINRFDGDGIRLVTSDFNQIYGNYIGTGADGTVDQGNGGSGIVIDGSDNLIGGDTAVARNVIAGNGFAGISFDSTGTTTENGVFGNYIGLGADGSTGLGNGSGECFCGIGIVLDAESADNQIGDTAPGRRNVISGNVAGIYVDGAPATIIAGNYIGSDATGQIAVGNEYGIIVHATSPVIIGNVVSGNETAVIVDNGGGSITGGSIFNNLIGIAGDGSSALGNADGLLLYAVVGTIEQVQITGNTIANNFGKPITMIADGATRNPVLDNSIYDNSEAFDLGDDGADTNDAGDPDVGPNRHQNYPVIDIASPETGVVEGTLNSTPNTSFRIQVFLNQPTCGSNREGRNLLVESVLATDGGGDLMFSFGGLTLTAGHGITATATDPDGNTSEFSDCFTVANEDSFTIGFEGLANMVAYPGVDLQSNYGGITWENWKHYAPYPVEFQANGVNAIFAANNSARFTFSDRVFLGASFSRYAAPEFDGSVYFEMYLDGVLVATSGFLTDAPPALTFLASGYSGLVDEVRVISTGYTMTPDGSTWVMDDVEFDPDL